MLILNTFTCFFNFQRRECVAFSSVFAVKKKTVMNIWTNVWNS